jgi:hypothetical protein
MRRITGRNEYPQQFNVEPRPDKGVNRMGVKKQREFLRSGLATAMIALAGCAGMQPYHGGGSPPQQVAAADRPPPMVQNCGIVSIGSPTKYACDGKVYTSFDLLKLRQDWEKNHGG